MSEMLLVHEKRDTHSETRIGWQSFIVNLSLRHECESACSGTDSNANVLSYALERRVTVNGRSEER